jgi:2-keto-4-pentenoate hydratase/2-oxohepta-3-ene-1,7-dioic acid hydratase in catechol pathway
MEKQLTAVEWLHEQFKAKGLPWEKAKGFDGAAVIGNWFPKSNFKNVDDINFSLQKNDIEVQKGNTSHMMWKIDEIIEYVSKYFTLKIGDIIFTGTPAGVSKVEPNDQLKGFIENQEALTLTIK